MSVGIIVGRQVWVGEMEGVMFMREVVYEQDRFGEVEAKIVPLTKGP